MSADPQRRRSAGSTCVCRAPICGAAASAIGALDLAGTIDDPTGIARTDATLKTSRVAGAAGMNGLNGTIKGDRNGLDIALQATGVRTDGTVAAKVELAGEQIRIALSRLDGRHEGIPIALAAPTRVTIAGARIAIDPASLRLGGGRLAVRGVVDPAASDLQLELAALPLSLIDAFAPGTGLDGTLQAKLRVQGPMDAPRIDATYTASNLRLRRKDAALLPPISLQGTGTLVGRQATVDAQPGGRRRDTACTEGEGHTAPGRGAALGQRRTHRHARHRAFRAAARQRHPQRHRHAAPQPRARHPRRQDYRQRHRRSRGRRHRLAGVGLAAERAARAAW